MKPSDLLDSAPRLAATGLARVVITSTGQIARIISPGSEGKQITVKIEATQQKVKISPEKVSLIPLPAPATKKLAIDAKCDNCSNPGKKSCPLCGAPICSDACMKAEWKTHRPKCMHRRADKVALEYAREENRGLELGWAAFHDDVKKIKKFTDGLTHAAAVAKFNPKMAGMAMKVFVDFIDKRDPCTAAYGAAQEGSNRALRMLAELNADLNLPTTDEMGGRPAHKAAENGRTSTIELLVTLRADIWLDGRGDGHSPLHSACRNPAAETDC